MNRDEAWSLVQSKVTNRNLQKHMLATEACLGALAARLGGDEAIWRLAGLVHDLDYEQTKDSPAQHGLMAAEMLAGQGVGLEVTQAVKSHAGNAPVESLLDKVLFAVDPVTGLVVAAALMHPSKKLAEVTTDFIMRRYGERRFAAGANREQIATCSSFGMTLEDFVSTCLSAMQSVSTELGL